MYIFLNFKSHQNIPLHFSSKVMLRNIPTKVHLTDSSHKCNMQRASLELPLAAGANDVSATIGGSMRRR